MGTPHNHDETYTKKSVLTSAGDLIMASAASTPARLAVGTEGQVLTPISGVPGWGEAPVGGECRLVYTSATVLTLERWDGYRIVIDNITRAIPTAGVTLANSGVANTTYYIYAYWTGSVIALVYDVAAPAIDSRNRILIKTGDATRSLVGMARTNASGQWVFTNAQMFVLSWYNQRVVLASASLSSNFSTASTSAVTTGVTFEFLCWGGVILQSVGVRSLAANTVANACGYLFLFIDAAQNEYTQSYSHVVNYNIQSFSYSCKSLNQGYHLATIKASVSSGTTTWNGGESNAFVALLG